MNLNKRTLLAVGSFLGLAASVFCAVKDSFKAKEILDEKKPERLLDKFVAVAPCYISTAVSTGVTAACIAKGYTVGTAQIATAAGLGAAAIDQYHSYRKAVKNELGTEKEHEIYAMAVNPDHVIFPELPDQVGDEEPVTLFYDVESETYFRSTVDKVQQAIYHLNRQFQFEGELTATAWYDYLGVPLSFAKKYEFSKKGWSVNQFVEDGWEIAWIDLFRDYVCEPGKEPYFRLYFACSPNKEALDGTYEYC